MESEITQELLERADLREGEYEYDELCPCCWRETAGVQNIFTDGYEIICNHCGESIMVCSLCYDDNVECSKCSQVTERKRIELIKAALKD